jgi:hypothetical protein
MRMNQRGEGRLGLLIAIVVVAAGVFLGFKIIPVRIAAYELRDFVEEQCRYAALHKDNAKVAKRIMDKADELEIPLERKALKLKRTTSEMIISASYEQPIDLKFRTYVFKYSIKQRAPLF